MAASVAPAAAAQKAKAGSAFETLAPISAACAVTAVAMYPVDVVRALKMASATGQGCSFANGIFWVIKNRRHGTMGKSKEYTVSEFIAAHGIRGMLSQGVVPEVLRATGMRIMKFFFFPLTHEAMWGKPTSKGTPIEKGIAGGVAVIPEVLAITTLELAKIGLQLDSQGKYGNSVGKLVADVRAKQGLAGTMIGWQAVQLRQTLWTGTYFATLDYFKKVSNDALSVVIPEKTPTKTALVDFAAGFLAGVAGAAINTPADVVRTNIQKEGLSGTSKDSALRLALSFGKVFELGKGIYAQKGLGGLYAGFGFKALHMGGSGAFVAMLIPIFAKMMGVNKSIM
ncbi:mitochondrial carrier [Gonapodya prolifera JEL478]|uniref:Mitochondrial carrier n=1 Tax=Gonapodya prolifera (strain JEL478) TaxID=1344416 RepID=A0A139B0A3_GONPJ|nr:mitochondrial carrier [Gonapodya prolifera JEL478]|eukprot:KXS22404.1 mitochondrial carrier [Gonapodya prolifera JEL478]